MSARWLLLLLLARAHALKPAAHESPDGELLWEEGAEFVAVRSRRDGRVVRRARLPARGESAGARRVLFGASGRYFCVVDERREEVGLHLKVSRGPRAARAVVVATTLHFMDSGGRILWTQALADKTVVGGRESGRALRIARDGALAILLQDDAPHTHPGPLLLVYDRRGIERLRLDYADWKTIDEFALSDGGGFLAVRGFGRIEERETWGPAAALYRAGGLERWVHAAPAGRGAVLRAVAEDGWACCLPDAGGLVAFGLKGARRALRPEEADQRFGAAP